MTENACQDYQAGESAVKCLSQGHNRMAQVDIEPRHVDYNHSPHNHHLTMPPTSAC